MKKNELALRKNLVEKRNIVNEMRTYHWGLEELRIFNTYLAKINARDVNTRAVRFPVSYFQALMKIENVTISHLISVSHSLIKKYVDLPSEKGTGRGVLTIPIFKACEIVEDKNGEWYMEIEANDKVLPLLFDYKNKYFAYGLNNLSGLKSRNQIRMYEILKQFENTGFRIVTIENLKEYLGVLPTEYPQYKAFKQWVIEPCRKALAENTDITFTYEPHSKKGRKIASLKFNISRNPNAPQQQAAEFYVEPRDTLADETVSAVVFAEPCVPRADETVQATEAVKRAERSATSQETKQDIEHEREPRVYTCVDDYDDYTLGYLAQAVDFEFTDAEMAEIQTYLEILVPCRRFEDEDYDRYKYLKPIYSALNRQAERQKIKSRFGYVVGILKKKRDEFEETKHKKLVEDMKEFDDPNYIP